MKTRKGIFYDLNESTYNVRINNLIFYFSSKFYLDKFKDNCHEFIKVESAKLKSKYNLNINFYNFLLIAFYKKVEKRGFRVEYAERDIEYSKWLYLNIKENELYKITFDPEDYRVSDEGYFSI